MKTTLPTRPIERLALQLREPLCLPISIVIGAVHGRADANELSNAVVRRIETIATKNVSCSAKSFGANLVSMFYENAKKLVNVRAHVLNGNWTGGILQSISCRIAAACASKHRKIVIWC